MHRHNGTARNRLAERQAQGITTYDRQTCKSRGKCGKRSGQPPSRLSPPPRVLRPLALWPDIGRALRPHAGHTRPTCRRAARRALLARTRADLPIRPSSAAKKRIGNRTETFGIVPTRTQYPLRCACHAPACTQGNGCIQRSVQCRGAVASTCRCRREIVMKLVFDLRFCKPYDIM